MLVQIIKWLFAINATPTPLCSFKVVKKIETPSIEKDAFLEFLRSATKKKCSAFDLDMVSFRNLENKAHRLTGWTYCDQHGYYVYAPGSTEYLYAPLGAFKAKMVFNVFVPVRGITEDGEEFYAVIAEVDIEDKPLGIKKILKKTYRYRCRDGKRIKTILPIKSFETPISLQEAAKVINDDLLFDLLD